MTYRPPTPEEWRGVRDLVLLGAAWTPTILVLLGLVYTALLGGR